jgi:hypothetical protein
VNANEDLQAKSHNTMTALPLEVVGSVRSRVAGVAKLWATALKWVFASVGAVATASCLINASATIYRVRHGINLFAGYNVLEDSIQSGVLAIASIVTAVELHRRDDSGLVAAAATFALLAVRSLVAETGMFTFFLALAVITGASLPASMHGRTLSGSDRRGNGWRQSQLMASTTNDPRLPS